VTRKTRKAIVDEIKIAGFTYLEIRFRRLSFGKSERVSVVVVISYINRKRESFEAFDDFREVHITKQTISNL